MLNIKFTEMSFLGSAGLASIFGTFLEVHGAFIVMLLSTILLGFIRIRQSNQNMRFKKEKHDFEMMKSKTEWELKYSNIKTNDSNNNK